MRPFGVGRITRQRNWIRDHVKIKEILERGEWTSLTTAVVLNTGEAAHLSANNTWGHLESNAFRHRSWMRNHEKIKENLERSKSTSVTTAVVLHTCEAAHSFANNTWRCLESNALVAIEVETGIMRKSRRFFSWAIERDWLLRLC